MSDESLEWQPPTDKNDDLWQLDFQSIDGSAVLYLERTELEGFEKAASAVILEDSKSGNREPVSIDLNGAEAENLLQDMTRKNRIQFIREKILELRGDSE